MDKEEEKNNNEGEASQPSEQSGEINTSGEISEKVSNKQKLNEMLREILGEGYSDEDEEATSSSLIGYLNTGRDRQSKLADALTKDPRLAQLLADVVGGKRNAHGALARYFGKDFLSAEEGTPEYEELMSAEEERKKESEAAEANAQAYSKNLDESMPLVEEFCQEKGYDIAEYLDKVWNQIVSPILNGMYSRELCEILDNGLNYQSDITEALKAGETKGRNMKIERMRKDDGDGLPKGIMTSGSPKPEKRRKENTILDMAKDA